MRRFSIVLPTTDRSSLLPAAVRAVLEASFDDFELLVSDNFSQVPAAEILADVHDKRLRILRTDRRLAAPDHWEFVWEHVGGDYVMVLGDDNALHPDILAFADRAVGEHDLDILSWRCCLYFHPDWNVVYGSLPDQGNVLGIDAGTTRQLYECRADEVLRHFCRELRIPGCFPCMLNFLFRKSTADMVRKRIGRLFWAPNPDISSSHLLLGVARPGGYAFYDGFGAIGGRSRDSNLAAQLSRRNASRRILDYIEEFRGQDLMPRHTPKFFTMSNSLAASISQAKALMPERFARYDFDRATLARRTIDDLYVSRCVPWMNDLAFLAEVDQFIHSLPGPDSAEIVAYRDRCVARMWQPDNPDPQGTGHPRNYEEARVSLYTFLCNSHPEDRALAWRLFRDTGRNPLGRYWVAGATTYVDMRLFDGGDIADAARALPRVLAAFDHVDDGFARYHAESGMLGEPPSARSSPPPPAAASRRVAGGYS
jgi:glycosyltransferase involved in cell wall biosynthesis